MAGKSNTYNGVIAVLAIFVLCLAFPRRTWSYIVVFVGAVWAGRALIVGTMKQSPPADLSRAKADKTAKPVDARAQREPHFGAARSPEVGAPPGSVATTSRFVPDGEPVSVASKAPYSPVALPSPSLPITSAAPRRFVDESTPVPVVTKEPSQAEDFAIPPAPAQVSVGPGRWIPPGDAVVIGGSLINGGMIYVGRDLEAYSRSSDPCLINPALPIASQADASERGFGYWPSYSAITPTARRAYLRWLAGGRCDLEADLGCVFLFFYGLERRAIIDGQKDEQAQRDRSTIARELRRLLEIYGEKFFSFKSYASALLSWLEVSNFSKKLYEEPIPSFPSAFEIPLYVRLALGRAAVDRAPVPGHLALAWVKLDPTSYLRTPATRCAEQFDALFLQRYAETFNPGIVLPRNKTKLKFVYRPASAGFGSINEIRVTFGDTPDVTVLTAPQKQLKKVVDEVTNQLDPYSRYLGRNPEVPIALEGLLLLPPTIWPKAARDALKSLQERVVANITVMKTQELLDMFQAKAALNKERAVALAKTLDAVCIGLEPDILRGARTPKGENYVVLFAAPELDGSLTRTATYQVATLTLQLASAVASVDGELGEEEMEYLRGQVRNWPHLTLGESARLLAHLRLLAVEPVSLASLKKRLEALDASSKETIAAFMATVAQADGMITPAKVKILEKVYKTLGLDIKKVFADVHAVATGAKAQSSVSTNPGVKRFQLDVAKISALQKDSERVSALLADIFEEESPPPSPAAALVPESQEAAAPTTGLLGLDEAHSAFARMLLSRSQWTRDELLDVSSDLDLMLDGALERINEVSFDTYDIPFTEGDDPIDVSPEILEKLKA